MKPSKYNLFFSLDDNLFIVYNTLTRSLMLIDRELYELLLGDMSCLLTTSDIANRLFETGIIIRDDTNEDIYIKKLYQEMFSDNSVSLWLSLTSRCNLVCPYCYQSTRKQTEGEDLTYVRWKYLYRYLVRKVNEGAKNISLVLYGGEPLLNPTISVYILKDLDFISQEYGITIEKGIITNGTIYNEHVEEVFDRTDYIQITIDGSKDIHNKRRYFKDGRGSFDIILSNLLRVIEKHSKKVILRINIDEHNHNKIEELLDFLAELGLHNHVEMDIAPVYPDQACKYIPFITSKNLSEYYISMSKRIIELIEYVVKKGFKASKAFSWGSCMVRAKNGYAVDEKLNLYLCPGFLYTTPLGYINSEGEIIFFSNIKEKITSEIPSCVYTCVYGPICWGGCVFLKHLNVPTCPRVIFTHSDLERLMRAYVTSRYREVVERARRGDS